MKRKFYVGIAALAVFLVFGSIWPHSPRIVHAADNNFSDGITVDSTGDGADANTADSICDDGSGNCTLRAAIQESNQEAGTQTIKFNITGTADFTNGGQNGYSILPNSGLPDITDTVIIDGYSQPNSLANTAVSPNPFNGRLLVELDGNGLAASGFVIVADDVEVRGLVINNFDATAIQVGPGNIIQGNYIGTNPTGLIAKAVGSGINAINSSAPGATNVLIGGLDPEDRNLISGNTGSGVTPNTGDDNWTTQGNYFGLDATGLSPLPLSFSGGPGALSLDNSDGHIIGGSQPGAINVIGASLGHGIAPHNSDNLVIEGNYIGLGYDGFTVLGNTSGAGSGIIATDVDGATINNNRISGWTGGGIGVSNGATDINITGNISNKNTGGGNITLSGLPNLVSNIRVQANKIGVKADGLVDTGSPEVVAGIQVAGNVNDCTIGGDTPGEANIIAGNNGAGIIIGQLSVTGLGTFTPAKITILGNVVYGNNTGTLYGSPVPGLGIDLNMVELNGFTPQSSNEIGPTLNDPSDSDIGPNSFLNFPTVNSTSALAGNLDVNFNLEVDNSAPGYRVEFFANSTADPSGYGEGQIYLGGADVSGSVSNATASLAIPSNFTSGTYAITATTTEKDNSSDGFGNTSEFSAVLGEQTVLAAANGNLANTGENNTLLALLASTVVVAGVSTLVVLRRRTKTLR